MDEPEPQRRRPRTRAARRDSLRGDDVVVWLQFGLNHVPRAEDFPVMPCENLRVTLRPVNLFVRSPALDVPPSTQAVNCSVPLNGVVDTAEGNGAGRTSGTNGTNGACCA